MRQRRRDGRVHLGGTTVAERIRASVEHDLADLLSAVPPDEEETPTPPKPGAPRELVLGVDVFMMPDGSYALSPPPPVVSREEQAQHWYDVLQLEVTRDGGRTPCDADPRFIADPIPAGNLAALYELCDRCPVRALCRGYADETYPEAGFWGGRDFTRRTHDEMRKLATPLPIMNGQPR